VMEVIEFIKGDSHIGLVTRNGVAGPEQELLAAFKSFIPSCFRWRRGAVAIFHEPQLETGFPDLVAVQYVPETFNQWSRYRCQLTPLELKVLHHLYRVRGADSASLMSTLGIDARRLLAAIERLLDANMITRSRARWVPRPLKSVFGLRAIVAVEAKIKNWSDAFRQGELNRWFASESYVLSPINKPTRSVSERSLRTGVGILLLNGSRVRRFQSAQKSCIPASYGSWMFNEWIGRCLNTGERRIACK